MTASKLIFLAAVLFTACSHCESDQVSGTISGKHFRGSFITDLKPNTQNNFEVRISLTKKDIHVRSASVLLSALENPENWDVAVNGKSTLPVQAFPELSNTMNSSLNLLLQVPAVVLPDSLVNMSITYHSDPENFKAVASPESIQCHCQSLSNYHQ